MLVYRPKQQRQIVPTDPNGGVNCTAYGMAMAIDRATLGGCIVTGEYIRAHSNEPTPDPNSPGLNVDQVVAVADKMGVNMTAHKGGAFVAVTIALQQGKGVGICIDYDAMGTFSCQKSFLDFHFIFLNNLDSTDANILTYDPLCLRYRWVPVSTIRAAAEKFGRQTGGLWYFTTRITPNVEAQVN